MRALTVFVIVMGVIIVVGFGIVAAVIAGRLARGERGPAARPASAFATRLDQPQGARIGAMTTASDRLILELLLPDGGQRLVVVDLKSGISLGTIDLSRAQ